jgi:hypothetical protein
MEGMVGTMSDQPVTSKRWVWGYVLHNLTLKEPLECEYLAIVPHSDARVQPIVGESPLARCLVENFTDQLGRPRHPSVLVLREDTPATIRQIDAVVSFRNLIAITCVIFGWQQSIGGPTVWGTLYSDYFDFYPTTITADGKAVRTITPAVNDFGYPKEIHGQTSPGLPSIQSLGMVEPDESLVHLLMEAWNDLYVGPKRFEHEATALFRSLQVAYLAAAMPMSNERSIHDYGTAIALWVSAFEILAHPVASGGTGKADFEKVKELLEKHVWSRPELRECKHVVIYGGNKHDANLVVNLYWQLYRARNDFLHGNPVSREHLFPFGNDKRPPLPHLAPLVYKAALLGYLDRFEFRAKEPRPDLAAMELPDPAFDRAIYEAMKNLRFEEAILHAVQDRTE